jgi:hypothetical protein
LRDPRSRANEVFTIASNTVDTNSFVTNHDAQSNIATVAVSIRKVPFSTNSLITVSRVVNATSNVAILKLAYSGAWDLDGYGMCSAGPLAFPSADLPVSYASAHSTVVLKVAKKILAATEYDPRQLNE